VAIDNAGTSEDQTDLAKVGGTVEQLRELTERAAKPWVPGHHSADERWPPRAKSEEWQHAAPKSNGHKGNGATPPELEPWPIERVFEIFERWLILPSRTPVYAVLGTVAANLLPGDPVWLGLVASRLN
jgi:hypothetical protein